MRAGAPGAHPAGRGQRVRELGSGFRAQGKGPWLLPRRMRGSCGEGFPACVCCTEVWWLPAGCMQHALLVGHGLSWLSCVDHFLAMTCSKILTCSKKSRVRACFPLIAAAHAQGGWRLRAACAGEQHA